MVRNIDLNALPAECQQLEEDDTHIDLQHDHLTIPESSGSINSMIDVNSIDGDIRFLTYSEWADWAINQPKRTPSNTTVIEENLQMNTGHSGVVEEPVTTLSLNSKKLHSQISLGKMTIGSDNADENCILMENNGMKPHPDALMAVSEPTDTLTCPVCMCALTEPSSTICGHLFCRACIETSISRQKKCPMCQKKLTKKNFHRIYFS